MSAQAVTEPRAPPASNGPGFVYFWGRVREHVNRIALEYARRLDRHPVWLSIPDGPSSSPGAPSKFARRGVEVYRLAPGEDIDRTPVGPVPPQPGNLPSGDLAVEVGKYLQFPTAARYALRKLSDRSSPGVLAITNIDRLGHLGLLTDTERSNSLMNLMRARGITVIVTSKELIHAAPLPLECAFEVDSSPDDAWSEAEIYPGTPVSCCTYCAGSTTGDYATCSPALRSACPKIIPFSVAEA